MNDIVLKVENLSKKFCRDLKLSMLFAVKDLSRNTFGIDHDYAKLRRKEFWALQNINFELRRGETLGLIGINGSGKSTLLRLIAGLFPPDIGRIEINGKVASLIAVGAGFHPHMTGRENIYLNGAILGMSKAYINKSLEWIIDFAEIGDFLEAPISTYSSGMRVRLGFAIASCSNPDLLLLDEILAVGDRKFRIKCFNRIAELQKECAVVFVSHSTQQISRVCNKAMLIHNSKMIEFGEVSSALNRYQSLSNVQHNKITDLNKNILFHQITLLKKDLNLGENLTGEIHFSSYLSMPDVFIRVVFFNEEGNGIAEWQSKNKSLFYTIHEGENRFKFTIENVRLQPGEYPISIVISQGEGTGTEYILLAHAHVSINMITGLYGNTSVQF